MNRIVALAVVIALGAGAAQAKATYCQDPTTHKRISCKTAPVTASPAAMAKPTAATAAAPAKKPSMLSGLMKPRTASTPMQSPTSSSSAMATGGAPHCTKGKICGHSCIAMAKVCHKP